MPTSPTPNIDIDTGSGTAVKVKVSAMLIGSKPILTDVAPPPGEVSASIGAKFKVKSIAFPGLIVARKLGSRVAENLKGTNSEMLLGPALWPVALANCMAPALLPTTVTEFVNVPASGS